MLCGSYLDKRLGLQPSVHVKIKMNLMDGSIECPIWQKGHLKNKFQVLNQYPSWWDREKQQEIYM